MTVFEDFVTEQVQHGRSILGLYPATEEQTRTDFAAWRKAKDGEIRIVPAAGAEAALAIAATCQT